MDWFLYDNGLRHERVKFSYRQKFCSIFKGKTFMAKYFSYLLNM